MMYLAHQIRSDDMTPEEFNNICKEYDKAPDSFAWDEGHPIFRLAQHNDDLTQQLTKVTAQRDAVVEAAREVCDWEHRELFCGYDGCGDDDYLAEINTLETAIANLNKGG